MILRNSPLIFRQAVWKATIHFSIIGTQKCYASHLLEQNAGLFLSNPILELCITVIDGSNITLRFLISQSCLFFMHFNTPVYPLKAQKILVDFLLKFQKSVRPQTG